MKGPYCPDLSPPQPPPLEPYWPDRYTEEFTNPVDRKAAVGGLEEK
jgi:hypothetical protein